MQYVDSCVCIHVVVSTAVGALPFSYTQVFQRRIPAPATVAQLGRWIPFIHLDKIFTSVI